MMPMRHKYAQKPIFMHTGCQHQNARHRLFLRTLVQGAALLRVFNAKGGNRTFSAGASRSCETLEADLQSTPYEVSVPQRRRSAASPTCSLVFFAACARSFRNAACARNLAPLCSGRNGHSCRPQRGSEVELTGRADKLPSTQAAHMSGFAPSRHATASIAG